MTRSTEGMSRPRDATSVAIKIRTSPDLNRASEATRCRCFLTAWSATDSVPSALSVSCSSWHVCTVPANTMTERAPPAAVACASKCTKYTSFTFAGTKQYSCLHRSTTFSPSNASKCIALAIVTSCSAAMERVMVAENNKVCRPATGRLCMMIRSSDSNPGSRSLSASSRTRIRSFEKDFAIASSYMKCSIRRPGVATTTCGRVTSVAACARISTPPTTTWQRSVMPVEKATNWSAIWVASSRVGVRQRQNTP
mmetsp:Transcript_25847/g.64721  ORF Transcript_25847/g.64721 Transcript_25847/m.64721 type:complete len:253 (+) Transcript_25847:448-1206(+)